MQAEGRHLLVSSPTPCSFQSRCWARGSSSDSVPLSGSSASPSSCATERPHFSLAGAAAAGILMPAPSELPPLPPLPLLPAPRLPPLSPPEGRPWVGGSGTSSPSSEALPARLPAAAAAAASAATSGAGPLVCPRAGFAVAGCALSGRGCLSSVPPFLAPAPSSRGRLAGGAPPAGDTAASLSLAAASAAGLPGRVTIPLLLGCLADAEAPGLPATEAGLPAARREGDLRRPQAPPLLPCRLARGIPTRAYGLSLSRTSALVYGLTPPTGAAPRRERRELPPPPGLAI